MDAYYSSLEGRGSFEGVWGGAEVNVLNNSGDEAAVYPHEEGPFSRGATSNRDVIDIHTETMTVTE